MNAPPTPVARAGLPLLKTLYLTGCPISKLPLYRDIVLGMAPPTLEQLDADMLPSDWKAAVEQRKADATTESAAAPEATRVAEAALTDGDGAAPSGSGSADADAPVA